MKNALLFFMHEVGEASKLGHVVDAVEAEETDSGEIMIMAMSEDDSVLAVATLEPQEGTLQEVEQLACFLGAVVVGCEEALSGGLVKEN